MPSQTTGEKEADDEDDQAWGEWKGQESMDVDEPTPMDTGEDKTTAAEEPETASGPRVAADGAQEGDFFSHERTHLSLMICGAS